MKLSDPATGISDLKGDTPFELQASYDSYNREISLSVMDKLPGEIRISLNDMSGNNCLDKYEYAAPGMNYYKFCIGDLSAGLYLIDVTGTDGFTRGIKCLVSK